MGRDEEVEREYGGGCVDLHDGAVNAGRVVSLLWSGSQDGTDLQCRVRDWWSRANGCWYVGR